MSEHRATWQMGFLNDELGGLRIVVQFDHDDEPPKGAFREWLMEHERELVDVRAETVVDEWCFSRSLLLRDDEREIIRGTLRMGKLRWRALRYSVSTYADLSPEQVARVVALHGRREQPTDRQKRGAKKRIAKPELRAMLEGMLTVPELGAECFRRWGRQFKRWEIDAGPLSVRGRARQGDARRRDGEQDEDDVARRLWVAPGTPGQRRWRDGRPGVRLPTEPRAVIPPDSR